MKKLILTAALLGAQALFGVDFSVGIQIGPPPPLRVMRVPPPPGPEFFWVDGYWYPMRGRYVWHDGYYTRAPFDGARWIAPRYDAGRYYEGYWDTRVGPERHDHRWDRGRDRDWNRGRGWGRGHNR